MKKRSKLTEDRVQALLKEAEQVAKLDALRLGNDDSGDTFAKGAKHGGLSPSDQRRLKQLEDENQRLRSLVADLVLSNHALKLAVSKKW